MKVVLLLLAAVTLAAASWSSDTVKAFSPNREYRYDYESQILTGIPTLNSQYSGLKIKARVLMHVAADNYVSVKLVGCEVFSAREDPGVNPTTWLPSSHLEPVPSEHSVILVENLVKAIKFRYVNGLVTKIYAMDTDPYWSVNIKRGVLSMLNLDLNAENPATIESSSSKSFMNVISTDYNTMSTKSSYRVVESSTLGDCETIYSLVPVSSASKIMVSKVIDTKRCYPKVMAESGLLAGIMLGTGAGKTNSVAYPSIAVDYVLSGSRHEFLIKSAVLTGKYTFAPIVKESASIDGYVISKLAYIQDEPIDRPITFESSPVPLKKGLHAYIPLQGLATKESFSSTRMGEESLERIKIDMIDNLLEAIVEKTTVKVSKEVPDLITTVATVLRKMSKPDIMEVVTKYFSSRFAAPSATTEKKQTIIMDVLSTLPHPEAPIILVEMIKKGYIKSDVYGALLINVASLVTPPSPVVVNTFLQLAKGPVIRSKPYTYRAVILGAGILANKLVNVHMKMGLPITQTSSIMKGAVKELKTMLETSNVTDKISVIKAIGNTGMTDFIPDLERVIKDKSHPNITRKMAVFALRRLTTIAPAVIQSVALPVYLDVKEVEDVRIAAFLMIMETKPCFATMHMIGRSINYEPNKEVAVFAYKYMQNIARSSIPEMRPLSIVAKRVLMTVTPIASSPLTSSSPGRWEAFSEALNISSTFSMDKIHTASRSFPSSVISRLNANLFGKNLNIAEFGFNVTGLDDVIRKLVGTNGIMSDILSGRADITEIFAPLTVPDMGEVEDEIRRVISQTELPKPVKDMVRITSHLSVLGYETNYMSIGMEEIIRAIDTLKTSSFRVIDTLINGYNVDFVKAVPLMDNSVLVPTPVGLPLTVNFSAVSVLAIKGHIKVEGRASLSSLWYGTPKVTLGAALRPSVHIDVHQTVGIHHDIIKTGTTVNGHVAADVPIAFKVIIDKAAEKISLKINVPKEAKTELSVAVKPRLFTHFVPVRPTSFSASMYDMHLPKPVALNCDMITKPIPFNAEYVVPILSMKLKASGIISYPLPPAVNPVLVAISKQELYFTLEPTSSAPEAVVLEVIYGERKVPPRAPETESSSWFNFFQDEEAVVDVTSTDGLFTTVIPSPIISNPVKNQVFVNLMTVGGYNEAMIKTKLTLVSDPTWKMHQINCQVVGTPFIKPIWKAKFESVINLRNLMEVVIVAPRNPAPGLISSTEMSFGVNSFAENTIKIKTKPVPESSSPIWPIIESPVMPTTMKSVNLKMIVDYSRLQESLKLAAVPVMTTIKYMVLPYVAPFLYKETSSERNSIIKSAESAEVFVQIIPKMYKINAMVADTTKTYFLSGIPVPKMEPFAQWIVPVGVDLTSLPTFPVFSSLTQIPEDIPSAIYDVCKVTPANITTLDNVTISLPEMHSACEMVLAHDCSPQKLYTVVSTPASAAGVRTITIIVPHFKVEVSQGLVHQGVLVKVNEAITSIPRRQPLIVTRHMSGKEMPALNITSTGSAYIITAPQVGLVVSTDGVAVKVKVSPLLRSRACGLCNHIPNVPISSRASVAPTITGIYSILPKLPEFIVKSAQCPIAKASAMPSY